MSTVENVVDQIHSFYVVQYRIADGLEEIGQHPLLGNKTHVYPHELKELNERNEKQAKEELEKKKMLKNGGLVKDAPAHDVFRALLPLGVLLLGLLAIFWLSSL